jgi:glucosylglycerate synthase
MQRDVDSALSEEACRHIEAIREADILVGIPSYNNVLTASFVISQVVKGLELFFPDYRSVIFISDGNSVDGTVASVKTVHLPTPMNLIPAIYVGLSGKGTAIKAIFEAAKYLNVKAVALVDSDLRSIIPEWMKLLISPTLSGTGLVVPFYNRRKYDGTITNFLCYPVTASLYGKDIRQPIGGDFGLSIALVKELLTSSMWKMPAVHKFGIDIFETHTALAKGFEVKQAFLGIKDHDPKDPTKHLAPMFSQVVGTMFTCAEQYEAVWRGTSGFSKVDMVGEEVHVNSQRPVPIDLENMMKVYRESYNSFLPVFQKLLSAETLLEFEQLKNLENSIVSFSIETWAKTVYTFIAAFHKAAPEARDNLVDALRILWTGRLAAFVKETLSVSPAETEKKICEQARVFEKLKLYLVDIF